MRRFSGRRFLQYRLKSAGTSLRWARSLVALRVTMVGIYPSITPPFSPRGLRTGYALLPAAWRRRAVPDAIGTVPEVTGL